MELLERARGMMAGIAVGNLLGIPFEGWSTAEQLRETHPCGVREIEAEPGYPDDDDLAQAIILAEACSEPEALDADDLMRRFWEWGELNGAGMGGLTRDVLYRYGGEDPQRRARNLKRHGRLRSAELDPVREPAGVGALDASRGAWEDRGRNAAGNGSVMRCGPVALRWHREDRALARNSAVSAAVTHWDPRCIWSTLLADFAIAACLRGEEIERDALLARAADALRAAGPELAQFELPAEPPDAVLAAVETALAADAQVADLELDSGGIGYAPKALAATLWAAHHAQDVEHGLSAIVSAGGDTDTNAAPAGAALGARFGLDAIPQRWRAKVDDLRKDRESLEIYADRLFAKQARTREDGQGES